MSINWQAFRLTIELAVVVSAILFAIGLPLAYWIAFSRWRWKFLVGSAGRPADCAAADRARILLLVALGSRSPLGRWWQSMTGHTLAFTFTGLVIGSILYSLPFAVQPFAASFSSVDRKLLAASATLGASPLRTFFRVVFRFRCRAGHGRGSRVCSHHGRVRSSADDWRQYSRRDPHRLH
jgi:molybdate transport system permease protein